MADTTPTLREAAQQALEALESNRQSLQLHEVAETVITALRAALAEQAAEQAEPVAWRYRYSAKARWNYADGPANDPAVQEEPLYAAPPAPAAAPAGEPAACISRTQGRIYAQLLPAGRSLPLGTSLYPQQSAAMFQPAPARQEPLTEERATSLVQSVVSSSERPIGMVAYGLLVARAVERAHGITAAPAEGGAA